MDNGGAFTDRLFAQAAIPRGATALDIGCGVGDVTFRLSRAVGNQGSVTAVDMSARAIGQAQKRASELGLTNTRFLTCDFFDLAQ
jgi:ubiquinone/menaquinone biosynthesis C-methylase UbiE